MTHEIKADWDVLLQQSKICGTEYFESAQKVLQHSGMQYTAADIVALAKVMAYDFHTASIGVAAQKICEAMTTVAWGLDNIADVMREGNEND